MAHTLTNLASAFDAFREAVQIAGGQKAFERVTGCRQQNTSNWLRKGRVLAPEFVLSAEQATGVSRHRLRPDIYPVDLPSPSSRTDGSITGGAPVVLSDRGAVSDQSGNA